MQRLKTYSAVHQYGLSLETNWEKLRFVCIDSESTGMNPKRDQLVSLAGVGLHEGEICIFDSFSIFMPIAYNTSSVTVHGITKEASAEGVEEPEALSRFLEWIVDGIIVGHHIQHDLILLNTACQKHFGIQLRNVVIDTMEAFLTIYDKGGFRQFPEMESYSLDALCELFNITPHDRHTAHGDAYLTAQILQRILKEAGKLGFWNLNDLHAWYADQPFPFSGS